MTINAILECYNKVNADPDSFLVYSKTKSKTIGNYYSYKLEIIQHYPSSKDNNTLIAVSHVCQISSTTDEFYIMEEMERELITSFLTLILKPKK